ncbi:MAG: ECF RNA polymerase sigma factor SigK [Actinomycetota bacterium]|nr:ECF RNA polymerase sigma factor SigK [Actinomycetota bacterium]
MSGEPVPLRLGLVPGQRDKSLDELLVSVGRGDESAFEKVYDELAASVYGLARRVVRDPARAEEIAQDVFLALWRKATRFDPVKGSARTWVMTMTHRRAVDVVRSEEASTRRETEHAKPDVDYDQVAEQATARLEGQQVRQCLGTLTDLQREAVTLAYFGGYTYREVAALLQANLSTVKTRMRDGLIRLRDCLGGTR